MTTPVIRAALERLLHDLIEGKMLDGAIAAASAALAEQPKTEQPPKNCWLDDEPDLCPTPCVFDDSSEAIYNCCFAIKLNAEEKPKETCKYYRAALAEQPARPTDDQIDELWDKEAGYYELYEEVRNVVHTALARWGQS